MKRKILSVSLVVVLLAVLTVGGSLAWFTDKDETANVFTIGSVKVQQHEKEHSTDNELVDFTQNQPLLPIVDTQNPAADENYIEKIVTVENTGKNGAYVRTHIAIPQALMGYLCIDTNDGDEQPWEYSGMSTAAVEGVPYIVYSYNYTKELVVGASTEALLEGVYLDSRVDIQDNPDTAAQDYEFCMQDADGNYSFSGFVAFDAAGTENKVNVLVVTQAIQVEGFDTYADALATFGTGNPWTDN